MNVMVHYRGLVPKQENIERCLRVTSNIFFFAGFEIEKAFLNKLG